MRIAFFAFAAYGLLACSGPPESSVDAGSDPRDSGTRFNADAAAPDAAGTSDAGLPDSGSSVPDAGVTGVDGGPAFPERCETDDDEDGDGYAGCADLDCWEEPLCEAPRREAAEVGVTWAACGDPMILDPDAVAEDCNAPPRVATLERELACGLKEGTVRAQIYCEPDGPGRALRVVLTLDVASVSESVGPSTRTIVGYTPSFGLGTLEQRTGSGGAARESDPTAEQRDGGQVNALYWVGRLMSGSYVGFYWPLDEDSNTYVIPEDGPPMSTGSSRRLVYVAGFQADLP